MQINWKGVMPATLTQFKGNLTINHALMAKHAKWLVEHGCSALVPHGSLGEGTTLSFEEKNAIQQTYVEALPDTPIIPGIGGLTTNGCAGLMVLPPFLYSGDWYEVKTHMAAVLSATDLPCLLYNSPLAYQIDFTPEQLSELTDEHPNLEAVKESSDTRRIAAIRELLGDRLAVGAGVDDCALEGAAMDANFWISGVAGQLPRHSVKLWQAASKGNIDKVMKLYLWMLPLLRMDTSVHFVQLLKLLQKAALPDMASTLVRPPRLELEGQELENALATIKHALANDPLLATSTEGAMANDAVYALH